MATNVTLADVILAYTMDDVVLATGDRVLLFGQTTASQNGIYVVNESLPPTRALDLNTGATATGAYCFVDQGTAHQDRAYVCITDRGSSVVGTNNLTFVQFSSRPSALAGYGLQVGTGNALDVNTTVIPDLGLSNTFTGNRNTFSKEVTITEKLTASASVDTPKVTGLTLANMSTPGSAVSVEYVGNQFKAFAFKEPVTVASTANITTPLTTLVAGATVDGITLATGNRVLLKNQTTATENGIYVVGADAETDPATRALDLAAASIAQGTFVFVSNGTLNGDQAFVCTNASAATSVVDTHALVFQGLVTQAGPLAGNGLSDSGAQLQVNVDDSTIEINADILRLKDSGIVNAKIANTTIENVKLVNDSVTVNHSHGLKGGQEVALGAAMTLEVDYTVVPDLAVANTFTAVNTFSNTTASTSRTTGALVVSGGLGVTGDLYVSNTYNMSDARLKKNVCTLDDALESVCSMRGCSFEWNEKMPGQENVPCVGVIAQEVKAYAPLCVSHNAETDLLAVEYTKLVPYLIESIKSLKRKCDELEAASPKRTKC
jgi:hypothetical protein